MHFGAKSWTTSRGKNKLHRSPFAMQKWATMMSINFGPVSGCSQTARTVYKSFGQVAVARILFFIFVLRQLSSVAHTWSRINICHSEPTREPSKIFQFFSLFVKYAEFALRICMRNAGLGGCFHSGNIFMNKWGCVQRVIACEIDITSIDSS